ncbi:MAG: hypothetical protein HZC36_08215 [Armatimonadetes bacterium]|nr:hypothetical protein [Armatimonadota bacterium]
MSDHERYMSALAKQRIVVFDGPWRDEPGMLAVIRARSDEEAQAVLDNDPGIQSGVLAGELKAWQVIHIAAAGVAVRP